jgi:hypothetical protein
VVSPAEGDIKKEHGIYLFCIEYLAQTDTCSQSGEFLNLMGMLSDGATL